MYRPAPASCVVRVRQQCTWWTSYTHVFLGTTTGTLHYMPRCERVEHFSTCVSLVSFDGDQVSGQHVVHFVAVDVTVEEQLHGPARVKGRGRVSMSASVGIVEHRTRPRRRGIRHENRKCGGDPASVVHFCRSRRSASILYRNEIMDTFVLLFSSRYGVLLSPVVLDTLELDAHTT